MNVIKGRIALVIDRGEQLRLVRGELPPQLTRQPRSRDPPIAHDRLRGNVENLGRFLNGESAKETQLDDLGPPGIDPEQGIQRVIQPTDLGGTGRLQRRKPVEIDRAGMARALTLSTALQGRTGPRGVNEDSPHHPCSDRQKVHAISPGDFFHVDQSQIRLVDQGRGLQRMARTLLAHVAVRQASQLDIEERGQLIERGNISPGPRLQETGDFA